MALVRRLSSMAKYTYETIKVTVGTNGVAEVAFNRPEKLNAMNLQFFNECTEALSQLDSDGDVRAVIVHQGDSRIFTAGLDLSSFDLSGSGSTNSDDDPEAPQCPARRSVQLEKTIETPQLAMSSFEKCRKPVIAVVDAACIGGGVDLICACDIRYCTETAYFCIKEVEIALAADIGTLQRLPKIIGNDSLVRELAFTARKMPAKEALKLGLVSRVEPDLSAALTAARETASTIAKLSPVAVAGTKLSLNFSRDHTTQEGLDHVKMMNATYLQSPDVVKAAIASMSKTAASYSKL